MAHDELSRVGVFNGWEAGSIRPTLLRADQAAAVVMLNSNRARRLGQFATPTGRTVLVVDDEAFIRIHLIDLMEARGFVVLEAADADEAIAIMEQHPEVEAVVTDIQMPGSMDGLRLSHFIRDRWPPTTLIVTSGRSMAGSDSLPADASFLPKPIDMRRLFAALGAP